MSYFRVACRHTIIGAAVFHVRVRNGNGWFHRAMITRGLFLFQHPAAPVEAQSSEDRLVIVFDVVTLTLSGEPGLTGNCIQEKNQTKENGDRNKNIRMISTAWLVHCCACTSRLSTW